jgi:amino acid transporter
MRPSRDIEMADFGPKEGSWAQGSVLSTRMSTRMSHRGGASAYSHDNAEPHSHPVRRWLDSFRRDPGLHVTPPSVINAAERGPRGSTLRPSDDLPPSMRVPSRDHHGGHYFDLHAANVNTANTLLSRELKGRHLQMIAIGGSIGKA